MCTLDMCDNHGTCVEQWNSYSCDCDMTAYVGPTCSEREYRNRVCYGKHRFARIFASPWRLGLRFSDSARGKCAICDFFWFLTQTIVTVYSVHILRIRSWRRPRYVRVPWRPAAGHAKRLVGVGFHHDPAERRAVPSGEWHVQRLFTTRNGKWHRLAR